MDNELKHYGVLGMRWGRRKGRSAITREAALNRKTNREAGIKNEGTRAGNTRKEALKKAKAFKEASKKANEEVDFKNLKNTSKKALDAFDKYDKFNKDHTYEVEGLGDIKYGYIVNPKLERKAIKYSKQVDKMVANMSKRYDTVSALPAYDKKTGKAYIDVTINGQTERIKQD